MRVATCFSGIGAPECAWNDLGWDFIWTSEIEPFPSAVLKHHHPTVPNLGDINNVHKYAKSIKRKFGPIDLICGGSPCQSFSIAGLRKGMDDPRGNLALVYLGVIDRFKPRWIVWENVPGVLTSNSGRDFEAFITALEQIGYSFAWRIMDAQYFGVPQRRRRVFVVGHLGDWRRAAAVLFEPQGMSRNIAESQGQKEIVATLTGGGSTERSHGKRSGSDRVTQTLLGGNRGNGGYSYDDIPITVSTLDASYAHTQWASGQDLNHGHSHLIAHTLRGEGFDASEDGTGRGLPLIFGGNNTSGAIKVHPALNAAKSGSRRMDFESEAFIFQSKQSATQAGIPGQISPSLDRSKSEGLAVFNIRGREDGANIEIDPDNLCSLRASSGGSSRSYLSTPGVRRITPIEAERLQGFPDDYTNIIYRGKKAADGPRYKSIGNSMAVPVMKWIGERIKFVDSL